MLNKLVAAIPIAAPTWLYSEAVSVSMTRSTSEGEIYNSSIQPRGLASWFCKIYYLRLVFSTARPQDTAVWILQPDVRSQGQQLLPSFRG